MSGQLHTRRIQTVLTERLGVLAFTNNCSCEFPFLVACRRFIVGLICPSGESLLQAFLMEALPVIQMADSLSFEELSSTMIATVRITAAVGLKVWRRANLEVGNQRGRLMPLIMPLKLRRLTVSWLPHGSGSEHSRIALWHWIATILRLW